MLRITWSVVRIGIGRERLRERGAEIPKDVPTAPFRMSKHKGGCHNTASEDNLSGNHIEDDLHE